MGKIIKIVIVIALAWFVWKKGLPWLNSYGFEIPGQGKELNTEGWGCVRPVEDVRDMLAETLSRARPNEPVEFLGKLREMQADAEVLCRCESRGCSEGREALRFTSEVIGVLSDPGRVGEASLNAARSLERIDDIIEQGKASARAGASK